MALTKTQIGYLQDKLQREVTKKIENFKKSLGEEKNIAQAILDEVKAGKVKLLANKDLIEVLEEGINRYHYYNPSFYITDLVSEKDKNRIQKELDEREQKIADFTDKLEKAKQNALDKIVLEGVDVETAMAILNEIE